MDWLKLKSSNLQGAWSVSRDIFSNFDSRDHISRTAEATVARFSMQVEYIKCLSLDDWLLPNGCGQGHLTFLKFCINHIFEIGEAKYFKFLVMIDT